jgi:arylsulfatase A-like enzyme
MEKNEQEAVERSAAEPPTPPQLATDHAPEDTSGADTSDVAGESGDPDTKATRRSATARGTRLKILLVPLAACLVFGALDATSVVVTSSINLSVADWPARFAYMLPWFLLAAALLTAAIGALSGPAGKLTEVLRTRFDERERRAGMLALMPMFALFITGAYQLVLYSASTFHNHRLGSLLVVLGLCMLLIAGPVLWAAVAWCLATDFKRRALSWLQSGLRWLTLPSLLAALLFVAIHNREGLEIIGGWLFAGPIGFAVTAAVGFLLIRRRTITRRLPRFAVAAGLLASVALAFVVGSVASDELPPSLTESNSWSARAVGLGRQLTDVDGDGFSSFFGGGDCAPFDSHRNPGELEAIGDGIDNDCFGGDAQKYELPRPQWYPLPNDQPQLEHVVVIVIEAMRPDAVSSLRQDGPESTPNIDRLGERGIVFPRMYSSAAATLWSLASLWTTFPPSQLHWTRRKINNKRFLDSDVRLIPERIQKAGFHSIAFLVHEERIALETGIGLDRGFDEYVTVKSSKGFRGHPSENLVKRWKRAFKPKNRSLSYLHLDEPHSPYVRHESAPDFGKSKRGNYLSEAWLVDKRIGEIVAHLEDNHVLDKTLIFITGDHGEAFGEHGRWTHGSQAYEEQVCTFGVLWLPGMKPRRVDMPVSHQDFGSTLMNLLNIREGFDELYGLNLIPYIRGEETRRRSPVITETHVRGAEAIAMTRQRFKLIYAKRTGRGALYDLREDPDEEKNVAAEHPDVFTRMMTETRGYAATQIDYE